MVANIEKLDPSSSVEKARENIKSKTDEMADAISSRAENVAETAKQMKRQAYKTGAHVREWMNDARDQAEEVRYKMEHTIRERPFLSAMAVFIAGMITTRVLSKK